MMGPLLSFIMRDVEGITKAYFKGVLFMKNINKLLLSLSLLAGLVFVGCGDDNDCPDGQQEDSNGNCVPSTFQSNLGDWDLANPVRDDQGNVFYQNRFDDTRLVVSPENDLGCRII